MAGGAAAAAVDGQDLVSAESFQCVEHFLCVVRCHSPGCQCPALTARCVWGSSVRAQVVTSTTLAALLILSALMVRAAVSVWCGVVAFTESLLS
eukprot:COSAG01_NODE_2704_length_7224_cov_114.816281_8_plen_94_part_00